MEDRKLKHALEVFFGEKNADSSEVKEAEIYLKKRIRSAMEMLIEEEEIEKIEQLEALGWFGERELEVFLKFAGEKGKTAPLMWLLHLKNKKYGYKDREFSL